MISKSNCACSHFSHIFWKSYEDPIHCQSGYSRAHLNGCTDTPNYVAIEPRMAHKF